MLFERIESEGLAHYSYIIGDHGEAMVIDPRRDIGVYLDSTEGSGYRLKYILETHRHEDFLTGSVDLARRTGAEIWHGDGHLKYEYGNDVHPDQKWEAGYLILEAINTPGHTPGSISYLLREKLSGRPWMVFSGDTLFAGEVGRVDLGGKDQIEKAAGELYDSIFLRLLPLGDGVILCPAHGPGSACGLSISDRPWTTIGIERAVNKRLQYGERNEFIRRVGVPLDRPPYFDQIELRNLERSESCGNMTDISALSAGDFYHLMNGSIVLDTRTDAFGQAHVPGALSIWYAGLSRFAGWFLSEKKPILLVCDEGNIRGTVTQLARMGFDKIEGHLSGGMQSWHEDGLESERVITATVQELCHRLDSGNGTSILDVRSQGELDSEGEIPGAQHVHIKELVKRVKEVPQDREVFIFCGSGVRSMTAASFLKQRGWTKLVVILGGFAAWSSVKCPIRKK